MDSSPVLRQQNQNKISSILRMKNEQTKINPLKSPKSAAQPASQDENKDPQKSAAGKRVLVQPGVSRLPVLAKSLHLPTSSNFSLSTCKWEEKPLAGKAKKERPCTRPLPFSRPHSKTSRKAAEIGQKDAARGIGHRKRSNGHGNPSKHLHVLQSNVDLTKSAGGWKENTTEIPAQLNGDPGTDSTFRPPAHSARQPSTIRKNTWHQKSPAPSAEACIRNMNRLSLKDPTKTSLTEPGRSAAGENFQADRAALPSSLCNEGPQRVSVPKNTPKPGPTAGLAKWEPFTPDPAALQSILQNEGVKVGGATPKSSIPPSGRGTSVYTAQRVLLRKQQVEATKGPAADVKEAAGAKWTPQRVPVSRHQPISAMKWRLSTQPSPYGTTPGPRSCPTKLQPQQEQEVVQRLFDDQEEEPSPNGTGKDPEESVQDAAKESPEGREESGRASEQQRTGAAPPFLQAPQRDSVIFFSTGKKLLRVPRFERRDVSTVPEQDRAGPSELRQVLPAQEERREGSEAPRCPAAVQSLHKGTGGGVQKSCAVSAAVAMLRKRLPPFEELRLDEEVATYASVCGSAATGFLPPRPRCGNPLAARLHFEESSVFIPIDPSPEPLWPCSLMEGR